MGCMLFAGSFFYSYGEEWSRSIQKQAKSPENLKVHILEFRYEDVSIRYEIIPKRIDLPDTIIVSGVDMYSNGVLGSPVIYIRTDSIRRAHLDTTSSIGVRE